MTEFKKGDRVIITKGCPTFYKAGDEATLSHEEHDYSWWAKFDNGKTLCLYPDGFKLAEKTEQSADKELIQALVEALECCKAYNFPDAFEGYEVLEKYGWMKGNEKSGDFIRQKVKQALSAGYDALNSLKE